jgi:hypothetical protein
VILYVRQDRRRIHKKTRISKFFTAEQIAIIDAQIEKYKNTGAIDISEIPHDSIWASLEDADEMPIDLYAWKPVYISEQEKFVLKYSQQQSEIVC